MNIIGLMIPKIVSLLMILIPSMDIKNKLILAAVWLIKLILDYDAARPSHGGKVYGLTKRVEFEVGKLIVACIQFVPAAIFLIATVLMKTWIPAIPGAVAILINFAAIICCIKDVIVEGKRRGERNANSNNKK